MSEDEKAAHLARLEEQAPDRCEMCDYSLPTFASRIQHIEDTGHCSCCDPECWGYIPPGWVYAHFCVMHANEHWNDHQISSGDASTLRDALPWVREAYKKRMGDIRDVDQWLGLTDEVEKSEALRKFEKSQKERVKKYEAEALAKRKEVLRRRQEAKEEEATRQGEILQNNTNDLAHGE